MDKFMLVSVGRNHIFREKKLIKEFPELECLCQK